MDTLGTQLRSIRTAHQMSRKQLAEASGVHCNTIAYFENDQHSPSTETLALILGALGYELCIQRRTSI